MKNCYLLMLFMSITIVAQSQPYYDFKHITTQDGLSSHQVNDIYKDEEGFVWFSTAWGLNRYDGYTMVHFNHKTDDEASLPSNETYWIRDINGDKMLVKHGAGFAVYDKRANVFASADDFFVSIGIDEKIDFAYVDAHKNIWLSAGQKCYFYHDAEEELKRVNIGRDIDKTCGNVCAMADKEGQVFIVYRNGAVATISTTNEGRVTSVPADVDKSPIKGEPYSAFIDSANDKWVCAYDGLWYCNSKTNKWTLCNDAPDAIYRLPNNMVKSVVEDKDHNIWVGTDHGGIHIIDKVTGRLTNLTQHNNNERSLLSNSVNCLYFDNNGVMWVGYYKAGVSLYDESMFKFAADPLRQIESKDFRPDVNCIEEDANGDIWLGTNGFGLVRINSKTGKYDIFRHSEGDRNSLMSDVIVTLKAAKNGDLWIGTFLGGLSRFDGRTFHNYKGTTNESVIMSDDNIWAIEEDENSNIWIGSLNSGLTCYTPSTKAVKNFSAENGDLPTNAITSLTLSKSGDMLVGTVWGMAIIEHGTNKSKIFKFEGEMSAFNELINDVYEDSRGLLWLCSRHGILIMNQRTGKNSIINMSNGLESEVVNGIVEDNNRNIWVSTSSGISNIVININPRNDDYTYAVYNYSEQDGLQMGGFNIRSMTQTSKGEVLAGGTFGINRFFPSDIRYNKEIPTVHFTDLAIFGKSVNVGEEIEGCKVLDQAFIYQKKIVLDYKLNMFSIAFSSLSYILPDKMTYSYKLEGFNDNWISTKQPQVTYTNLAPGTYTLYVCASNGDGYSSQSASTIEIEILPPWWRSPWAGGLYILIILAVIFVMRKQIMRKEQIKFSLQQLEADAAKKIEIDNIKMKFFTNVSHELRTPLSLIITPLESIIAETTDEPLKNKLQIVYRNANQLLQLVNQLLDFRKIDVEKQQLTLSNGDIVDFIKNACQTFNTLSERNIQMSFASSEDSIFMEFDRDKMGKVITNLLSNAFKYTNEDGHIDVWVGKSVDAKQLIIKVADTGIGIPDESKPHIFERFYQVPRPNAGSYGGSGIGLHIVHEFVALHKGVIEVGDNLGRGTVFTIYLPIRETVNTRDERPNMQLEAAAEAADSDETSNLAQPSEKPTVMVVDDNRDFRLLIAETLKSDYNIIEARDGAEAFAMAVKNLPDLILADVMMPTMDGNEFCRKIKNDVRTSHIPFVMLSAKSAEEHKIEGLSSGADEYMTKPFNDKILKLKIARLTELSQKRHETFNKQIEPEPSQITITTLDEKLIEKAIKYVEDNIADPNLSVEEMSHNLGMSRVHLYKKLLSITGRSPIEFIRVIRLKRAAQLLCDRQQNVADVAYAVGFNNPKYFSRYFKEEFGMLPSVYQSQHGEDTHADL